MGLSNQATAGAVSLLAWLPSFFTNDMTTPVIGAGVATIAGAALGTYAAIGYDDTIRPRGRLFTLAISTIIIATMLTGVLPAAAGWKWWNAGIEGAGAGLCAVTVYFLLPEAITSGRRIVRNFKLSDFAIFRRGAHPPPPPEAPPGDGDVPR